MSSSAKPQGVPSEDVLNRKMDLCLSNTILKTGLGFSAGVLLSVLFLRRRAWPVWIGTGFGLGAGYTDCERSFNPVSVPGVRIVPGNEAAAAPTSGFSLLQQRVGELFDSTRKEADKGLQRTEDFQQTAHERFAELSQSGREKLGEQVSHLQESTGELAHKLAEAGKDVFGKGNETAKDAAQDAEQKVRKI